MTSAGVLANLFSLAACALQSCLNKNTYAPDRCDDHVRKLYRCCMHMYRETNGKGESTACPMESVVKRWLKRKGLDVQ
ncbi:uncharacterized protein BXZ73DRAFT_45563 [Epithele typhae]|uniref:uncharacterized protein n=1 Tax=Epithele typhae TaxID=378194 RepID=UPI0020077CC1|nr:uncharacterized protein BXZ73DRAFT_45563 [Epithele typhae]KAH9935128.1 hypothetical protein BXZ73DRAFT_45563 [Epithele typhae]